MLYGSAIPRQLNSSLVKVDIIFLTISTLHFLDEIIAVIGTHSSVHSQDSKNISEKNIIIIIISLKSSCLIKPRSPPFSLQTPTKTNLRFIPLFSLLLSPFPPINLHLFLQDVTSTLATRSATRPCICRPSTGTQT